MAWREEMIAHYRETIAELQEEIDRLRSSTLERHALENDDRVDIHDICIKHDEAAIRALHDIVHRTEAELADATRA